MNIRAKLGLETYATVDQEPVIPDGPIEFDSPSGVVEQTSGVVQELADLSGSARTLEAIAQAIEAASEDDFTVSTAQIVAAAIDTATGPAETIAAEKLQQAGFGKPQAFRQAAQEALSEKFAAIKASITKLIEKIIEKLEEFWNWLTLNHKRVLKRLGSLKNDLLEASPKAELTPQKSWINLMHTGVFEPEKVPQLGGYLAELCISAGTFIESGIKETTKWAADPRVTIDHGRESMRVRVSAAFKHFKDHGNGEIDLYNGIAGRYMYLEINSENRDEDKTIAPVFRVELKPMDQSVELPHEVIVTKDAMRKIIASAIEAVDASAKHYDVVNRTRAKLRALTTIGGTTAVLASPIIGIQPGLMMIVGALGSYSSAISAFIDGIFLQSVRFGSAAADMGNSYVKHNASATQNNGNNEPAPADALLLAAK